MTALTASIPAPFRIGAAATEILEAPQGFGAGFAGRPAWAFHDAVEPVLLGKLQAGVAAANFRDIDFPGYGKRMVETGNRVGPACAILLNRLSLRGWLEAATGIAPLGSVAGSLSQSLPGSGHALDWHDDLTVASRKLGMVLNLSAERFEGGLFELRRKGDEQPFLRFEHHRPGTMTIFAVRPDLEHRLTPVTGSTPRHVFTGWFLGV